MIAVLIVCHEHSFVPLCWLVLFLAVLCHDSFYYNISHIILLSLMSAHIWGGFSANKHHRGGALTPPPCCSPELISKG